MGKDLLAILGRPTKGIKSSRCPIFEGISCEYESIKVNDARAGIGNT